MFLTDLQQLTDCRHTLLPTLLDAEKGAHEEVKFLGSVGLRNLKSVKLQRAVVLVGMFSLLESALQAETDWERPIGKLKDYLRRAGHPDLAVSVRRYELVVNTLKHGFGDSHAALFADSDRTFAVRSGLGDTDPGEYVDIDKMLVDVTHELVEECADTIEQVVELDIPRAIGKQP